MTALAVIIATAGIMTAPGAPENPGSLLRELQALDRKLTRAEVRLRKLDGQQEPLRSELAVVEADLAAARVREAEAYGGFQRRIRALARMPAGARLVLLGTSHSLAEYLQSKRLLRWIANHDRALQQRYVAERQRLSELTGQLFARKAQFERSAALQRAERDNIAEKRAQRLALVKSLAEDGTLAARAAQEQNAAKAKLTRMVQKLLPVKRQGARFAENRSSLPWPVAGRVSVTFGQHLDSASDTITTSTGIDIRTRAGTPVQAVFSGRVAFADWLHGYGQLVVVDHGEHYHTLVAHLADVAVTEGQEVAQGAILGTVGDTGSVRGTVLYFEVRQNGAPLDPKKWLKR